MRFPVPRKLLLLAFLVLLSGLCSAIDLDFEGFVEISLDQNLLQQGDVLQAQIKAFHTEQFPIADAYIVVEVVKGNEPAFPSHASNSDNIVFEQKIGGINLAPNSGKTLDFLYPIPDDLKVGSYRLDVYFKNKSLIAGIPFLLMNPVFKKFAVFGEGTFPEAEIVRTKTTFNGLKGQIGVETAPGSNVDGRVFVENSSESNLQNLSLVVSVCEWDDTFCETFEKSETVQIGSISAGQEKEIEVNFVAPSHPSAYAVRIELFGEDRRLLSLYRNRLIVTGASKKIHKLYVNDYHFNAGETMQLNALVGPTPDHYTNAVLDGSSLVLTVKDLGSGKEVFNTSIALDEGHNFSEREASFSAKQELKKFEVCGEIVKASKVFDSYCFTIDPELFAETLPQEVDISWNYNTRTSVLSINFCKKASNGVTLPIEATYFLQTRGSSIKTENISSDGCVEETLENIAVAEYLLLVNDLEAGRQKKEDIDLVAFTKDCRNVNCDDDNPCTENNCSGGQCSNPKSPDGTVCGPGKACQAGKCLEADLFATLLLIALIIILALIASAYFYVRKRKVY